MALSADTAADARNLAPREQFGAMAAVATSLAVDRGIPASTVEDVLIGAVLTEDALEQMPVFGYFKERVEKYHKDSNVVLRAVAKEHDITLVLKRKPGTTDPADQLADLIAQLANVQVPGGDEGFKRNVSELVKDGNPVKMIKEIERANKDVIRKCRRDLRQLAKQLGQMESAAERVAESSKGARRSTKSAKRNVRRMRRFNDDPEVVSSEGSSAEEHLDSGDSDFDDLENATGDFRFETGQSRSMVADMRQHMRASDTSEFQAQWMDAMLQVFPGLDEDALFEQGEFVRDPVEAVGQTAPDTPLDSKSVREIVRMSERRETTWIKGGFGTSKLDTGGARTKMYLVLTAAWKALEKLSASSRGSRLFKDQVVTLALALLYTDYALAYAAKTSTTLTDLGLKWTKNIFSTLWQGDARSMDEFENLKTLAKLRLWYKDTGVRALVLRETGRDL